MSNAVRHLLLVPTTFTRVSFGASDRNAWLIGLAEYWVSEVLQGNTSIFLS